MKIAKIELGNGISVAIREDQLPLTIGRAKDCDIRICEPTISRLHCELFLDRGHELCLKDLSANGTVVNNRTMVGESVRIGNSSDVWLADNCSIRITRTDNDGITLFPMQSYG
ncbi:MAG: FHA domain-containing protein [Pseudomonadales bacterium]|nr:FHA domain-containing protein [Pseudomonadales bacterium]